MTMEMVSLNDVLVISELRGTYPAVPTSPDIDYAALTAGDDAPLFITLPIGKANVKSGNKRYYDEAFLRELERQTVALKPVGLMGHLSAAERSTAFPQEAVHWIGVLREADTLWGKAYVVPGPARERIARYKASAKALATSIDAVAEQEWDESLKAFRVNAASLRLGQIDLAPADRAGIPELAEVPLLTSEMAPDPAAEQEQEPEMGKLEVINELSAEDARLLPTAVRQAVLDSVTPAPEVAQVAALRELLGVDAQTDLTSMVSEMQKAQAAQAKAAVERKVNELAQAIKVESVRNLVVEMVQGKEPKDEAAAESIFSSIAESANIKELLKNTVTTTMGPPQRGVMQTQPGDFQYFSYPTKEA